MSANRAGRRQPTEPTTAVSTSGGGFDKTGSCDKISLREKMETHPTIPSATPKISAAMELSIGGMSCNNCARHVTEAIQSVSGVRSATVIWMPDAPRCAGIPGGTKHFRGHQAVQKPVTRRRKSRPALPFAANPGTQAGKSIFGSASPSPRVDDWRMGFRPRPEAVVPVARFCARRRGPGFLPGRNFTARVEPLKIAARTWTRWSRSVQRPRLATARGRLLGGVGGHLYFMEAAAIITLISFGHWLEARVSARASGALEKLLNLAPQLARRVVADVSPRIS